MPANVSLSERAIVVAGLAKEVGDVNQVGVAEIHAAIMHVHPALCADA
jgi:hypothetical protein